MAAPNELKDNLVKGLGLLDGTTIVMGSMIGSGVFIVAADIARQVNSPGLLILTWIVTGILTLVAALSYGELAALMPHAGGQYVYLREAFGPLYGFLYGWTFFLVIQTGTIAAVAVAFAKFLGIFSPDVSATTFLLQVGAFRISSQQFVAIIVIVFLTWLNTRGLRTGATVQNIFTFAKVGSLLALIGVGVFLGRRPEALQANFTDFWRFSGSWWDVIRMVGVAMVGSLFSSDSWNNVTFTAGEMRNPKRNIPLSLAIGVLVVTVLYLASNFVYLLALPLDAIQRAPEDRVATAAMQVALGPTAVQLMAAAIMVSTFGCINGIVLAGARVNYAMALDGLFFKAAKRVDRVHHTPYVSLWLQCLWACLLTLTGRYGDLLDYVIFAVLLFYVLTIAGIFVLRRKWPDAERPYRALGYPVVPALYIAAGCLIEVLLLLYKPNYTWPGLIIVLLGIPVYWIWTRTQSTEVTR
jgi:basic amino acid/polyamine antiporter, APA family